LFVTALAHVLVHQVSIIDAEAFRAAMREPTFQYEFQSLDPDFRGE
jgi:hypothetical protein